MRTGIEVRELFNLDYNNINSGLAPGLNDYEISLYLTKAQREIIDEYYKGTSNKGETFEVNERLRKALSPATKGNTITGAAGDTTFFPGYYFYSFKLPDEAWRVI